ncbi:MAG TPA: hypothetical protein VKR82_01355 [Candidatus Acidoferrales bacterium]|nr:hypothetical protein [Candidatus Acidoferrales bacterium]
MDKIFEKLQNILEVWAELGRTNPGTTEYDVLMQKIQLLTSEYLSLMYAYQDASKKAD